jgi:hypothetical protein
MKNWIIFFVSIIANQNLFSQVSNSDSLYLKRVEDSVKLSSTALRDELNLSDRLTGDSLFTKQLVRALKVNYSFNYPFDSLNTCSKIYSPDSIFRIFTWQLQINEDQFKQRGVIQIRTKDGSMKIFPLIDKSDDIEDIEKHVGTNQNWIGAIYYKIVLNQYNNIPYYTLIGYDENSIRSNRKIIEVLTFKDNNPVFGGSYFNVPNDEAKPSFPARFIMEYKKGSGARLTYDEELQVIVKEHLISESNQPQRKWTLIGDGDYEGFKWSYGKWAYIEKIFDQITPEGKAPTPVPLRDKNGNFLKESKKQ